MLDLLKNLGVPEGVIAPLVLGIVAAFFVLIFLLTRKGLNWTLIIVGALLAGVLIGVLFPGYTTWIKPIGSIYISVLNAIVIPLVIVSIISSIMSLESVKQLRSIGLKSIFWLMLTTFLSIILAFGLALTFNIGANTGLSIEGVSAGAFENKTTPFSSVLVGFFPNNVVGDIVNEKIIPVIMFAVLIAVCAVLIGSENRKKIQPFKSLIESVKEIIFKAVDFIIELTPYAVLVLVANSIGNSLNKNLVYALLILLAVSFAAFIIDSYLINGILVHAFAKLKPLSFFKKIIPAQIVGFSTQSSAGTLPVTIDLLKKKLGVAPKIADFTAPLGTTIGMPGCAGIWPVLTALFGVQVLGLDYGLKEYALLIFVSLFVSLGTAGVPGTATITTASVLTAIGMPLEILVLTIPISAIADTGRTATNITAAIAASAIVARSENALDDEIFNGTKEYIELDEDIVEVGGADI